MAREPHERARGVRVIVRQSYESIEPIASKVRRLLMPDAESGVGIDGTTLFERVQDRLTLDIHKTRYSVESRVQELPLEMAALTTYVPERHLFRLAVSPSTYGGLERHDGRSLFTLCHEIGHLILHKTELIRMGHMVDPSVVLARFDSEHAITLDSEWQADAFASALIAPVAGVDRLASEFGVVTPTMLQDQFGLSFSAARRRLENIARFLRTDLRDDGVAKRKPGGGDPRAF